MKINLIAVGKLKEKYWIDAIKEYEKRLSRFCQLNIIEVPEGRTKKEEGLSVEKKLKGYVSIFDLKGEMTNSEEFAEIFSTNLVGGISEFSFVIGGSDGLCEEVLQKGNKVISFGRVTYPHQLMRIIVMEQIYRAMTINNNITYHK